MTISIYHKRNQRMLSCSMKNLSMMLSVDNRKIYLILTWPTMVYTSSLGNFLTVLISIKICGNWCKLFLLYLKVWPKFEGNLASTRRWLSKIWRLNHYIHNAYSVILLRLPQKRKSMKLKSEMRCCYYVNQHLNQHLQGTNLL